MLQSLWALFQEMWIQILVKQNLSFGMLISDNFLKFFLVTMQTAGKPEVAHWKQIQYIMTDLTDLPTQ